MTATLINGPKLEVKDVPAYRGDYSSNPGYVSRTLTWTGRLNGAKVEVTASKRRAPYWSSPGKKASPYFRSSQSESYRSYAKKPIIYVWFKDESVFENFANRESRPVAIMGKHTRTLLTALFGDDAGKIGWNQKAGCSCPCSPGFVWGPSPALDFGEGPTRLYDLSVSIDGIPQVEDSPRAAARRAQRAQALVNDPTIPVAALV